MKILVASHTGVTYKRSVKTKYELSLEKQIARCIADKKSPEYFDNLAARAEADAAAMRYGNKGAQTREARRCRAVAAALREAGL